LDAAQYYDRGVFISLLDLVDWFDSRMHERWKRHFMDFAPSVHIPATPSELWRLLACSEEPEG
jgi:hypothetical protein